MSDLTGKKFWDNRWEQGAKNRKLMLSTREMVRLIGSSLSDVPKTGKVLELGIAPGKMVKLYFSLRPDLLFNGIDISSIGIQKTKEIYEQLKICGKLYLADFRSASNLEGKFDFVCSHGLVEHFDDYETVIAYHLQYLKPSGLALITVPNYAQKIVKILLSKFSTETIQTHNMNCMSSVALSQGVKKVGGRVLASGYIGGPILPHSAVNTGFGGMGYRKFCQVWNLSISASGILSRDRLIPRFWEGHVYVLAKKI